MIHIQVQDRQGTRRDLDTFENSAPNLMESLKEHGYNMRATCGGMGLCADCHCLVLEGIDILPPQNEQELITLDDCPDSRSNSRLACQIKLHDPITGLAIRLMGVDE